MSIEETLRQLINEELSRHMSAINEKLDKLIKEPEDKLLTRNEKAKQLDVSLPTLKNWEDQGLISPVRIGRRVYFRKNDTGKNRL